MNRLYACTDYASDGCTEDFIFITSVCETGLEEKIALKLLSLGVVELCQQVWRQHFDDENLFEEDSSARDNMYLVMSATINLTDSSAEVCRRVIEIDLHADLFRLLDGPRLNSESMKNDDAANQSMGRKLGFVDNLLSVLYNVIQVVPEARELYRDNHAVDVFQKYRSTKNESVSCLALILQAYVVNEEDNERIDSSSQSFAFLARELDSAVRSRKQRSSQGYKTTELLTAVNKLAVSDKNKLNIIKSTKLLGCYVALCQKGCSAEEQFAAVQGLWLLSFSCADVIKKLPGCSEGMYVLVYRTTRCSSFLQSKWIFITHALSFLVYHDTAATSFATTSAPMCKHIDNHYSIMVHRLAYFS